MEFEDAKIFEAGSFVMTVLLRLVQAVKPSGEAGLIPDDAGYQLILAADLCSSPHTVAGLRSLTLFCD